MTPYYSTPERAAALLAAAARWKGTPFFSNSSANGVGVSCQFLAAALYVESGFMVPAPPEVEMSHSRYSRVSLVVNWVDASSMFEPAQIDALAPGDLLGFRIGAAVHHVGVVLGPGTFVHALAPAGVTVSSLADATWRTRLARAWRPVL